MTKRPIYYDTETTGLKPATDRIIEIAAFDPEQDRSFCEFINPEMAIPQESTNIHGITDEMVKESGTFKEVGQAFADFCEGDIVLIAHNNDNFDKHFLAAEAKRAELDFPDWVMLDSLKWARKYRPDLPRHTLQFLREMYGIEANQAHRALDDVKVLHAVFSAMIDDLDIETVLNLLTAEGGAITKMPFGKHQGKPLNQVPKNYVSWLLDQGAFDKPENLDLKSAFEKAGVID